ncbi:SDR family NAD(P)-dependent oxidoreductase [Prevotella sp. P6B4]|uniref:SDR family NAD(P)-dependent oxidoreductase n=1 Tax=Prevotella sp. P6B4 TaxID=1410614 RepID=UPI0018CC3C64|nr:SDR family oxidoreductase [Prevotella sp. P6B4]
MMEGYNPYSLAGKTVLVTGASSGIGRATAIECSRLGATVVATGRDEVRLGETMAALTGEGHVSILANLTNAEDVARLVSELPQIDGFVCNAGITRRRPVSYVKEEELREVFETNTFAVFTLTKAIMKAKKMNRGGSMVFISSMAARQVTPGNAMYAASKAALESFARSCAQEYAPMQVRANAILPGMVETPLNKQGVLSAEMIERDKQNYLLKRYGKPEEIAWAVIYLLSDASAWISGTSMMVTC